MTIIHNKMTRKIEILFFVINLIVGVLSIDDGRIVGGRPAEVNEFPYQVSIRRSFNDKHFCGGTIISPKHILTAAHCMFYNWGGRLPPIVVSVVVGQNELTISSGSVYRNASKIHIHEEFDNKLKKNDIAIIEIDKPLPIGMDQISIAALRCNSVKTCTTCTVTGWGVTEYGLKEPVENLLAADINIIDFARCQKLYSKANVTLQPGMLCAGLQDGSKDACQGDSGGPLFCNGLLTGVVSTAIGCANSQYPGIYSEINYYYNWINNITRMYNKRK